MAAIRYISVRSADDNPAGGTRPNFTDPFRPTSFVGAGHIVVPVENEQAMHVYEMHHVMAHLPTERDNAALSAPMVSGFLHDTRNARCDY